MLSQDQIDKIESLHRNHAALLESSYTNFSEHVTDVRISWIDQTTFGELTDSLSTPCHSYTFTLDTPGAAILDFALPVRNYILKLNGLERSEPESLITQEERDVMTKYTRRSLADLEAAWEPVRRVRITDAEIEQDPANLSIADRGAEVVLVGYECHMQHANGHIRVAYLTPTLDGILSDLDDWTPSN